jgi:hypothetical protein
MKLQPPDSGPPRVAWPLTNNAAPSQWTVGPRSSMLPSTRVPRHWRSSSLPSPPAPADLWTCSVRANGRRDNCSSSSFCSWSCWAKPAKPRTSLVRVRICSESSSSRLFCSSLLLHGQPLLVGDDLSLASARFWLMRTKVERKIASSETIIVRRPNGYFSTPKAIQQPNHKTRM